MPLAEPYIDAHCHIWTPDVAHYPLGRGFTVEDMKPRSFTAEELLAICRPAGVGRVNLIQMSYYVGQPVPPGSRQTSYALDNAYMLDMIKLYPERFVGTAIIDPSGPDPAAEMKALLPRGVRAFRIQPVGAGGRSGPGGLQRAKLPPARWLEPPGYAAMFAAAAGTGQALSCLINPEAFAEVDRMCGRFPGTTLIIDHLGRIGSDGTIRDAEVDALCALARHPKVMVKVGAFYALGKKTPPYLDLAPLIRRVVQAFGARRCMWESDCPFQVVAHAYTDSLALVRDRLDFLGHDDRAWLLGRTAEETLFRPL
jgi:predicted TIM-barrel fold metal-dependent hydrolase